MIRTVEELIKELEKYNKDLAVEIEGFEGKTLIEEVDNEGENVIIREVI